MPDPAIHDRMREDWDRRAREDARYYVAFGRRGQTAEEFFATATAVVHAIEVELERFSDDPSRLAALEIGCGPGRLLVPLSRRFGRVVGVDVSPEMVEMARRNLEGIANASATVTSGSDLASLTGESFDLCYSYAVFQHIPSREVVFQYLREAWRVLKPGGILKCQVNSLPDEKPRAADTWSGVRFTAGQIRAFCREQDFQLLELVGQDTHDMWLAARKQQRGWRSRLQPPNPAARLIKVTNTYSNEPVVPAAGRFACASLWVENLPPAADLNNLEAEIAGRRVPPCYVGPDTRPGAGPKTRKAPVQVNVFLPPDPPTGPVPVRLWMLDRPISNFARMRVIPAPPLAPRVLTITDGINLLSERRIETRSIKIDIDEAGPEPAFTADIDGIALSDLDPFCVDPLAQRYVLSGAVPPEIAPGPHQLHIRLRGRAFSPAAIEIAE